MGHGASRVVTHVKGLHWVYKLRDHGGAKFSGKLTFSYLNKNTP